MRNKLFGVDFSGSKEPSGSIWITEAKRTSTGFDVIDCNSASGYLDVPKTANRDQVYAQILDLIKKHQTAVFGFDFPFSLPEIILHDVNSWEEHIETINNRFTQGTADGFRKVCKGIAMSNSGSSHVRREVDWRYGGQCPYQQQLQYQSYHGQRDLLHPLVVNDEVRVLPMQALDTNLPWLLEVYPAASLSRLELYRQGYKNSPDAKYRREKNIETISQLGFSLKNSQAKKCVESDDAHDSLIATIGVYRAQENGFSTANSGPDIEGRIYK